MRELAMDKELIIRLIVVFLSLAIHEYAHAKLADAAGDPTPGIHGRVTLNPFAHFDPLGSVFIIMSSIAGFGIGWGKPVPMDPRKMHNPRWDHFWAVIGGPLSNLIQAVIWAILLKVFMITQSGGSIGDSSSVLLTFMVYGILVNISLFVFNLIPLGPLDGMWIVGTFLSEQHRYRWTRWNLTIGQFIFIALVLIPGLLLKIMGPPLTFLARFLGLPL